MPITDNTSSPEETGQKHWFRDRVQREREEEEAQRKAQEQQELEEDRKRAKAEMANLLGIPVDDDRKTLAVIVERFGKEPKKVSGPLDEDSKARLKGEKYSIFGLESTLSDAELIKKIVLRYFPKMELEITQVRDTEGNSYYAMTGIDAKTSDAIVQMNLAIIERRAAMRAERDGQHATAIITESGGKNIPASVGR